MILAGKILYLQDDEHSDLPLVIKWK